MLLKERKLEKTISQKIYEFDNFYFLNDRIYNKKHVDITDFEKLKYDDIAKATDGLPWYFPIDIEDLQTARPFEVDPDRSWREPEMKQPPWPMRVYKDDNYKIDINKDIVKLNELDRDTSQLYWFYSYDHSVWDFNMKLISMPFYLDYIEARLNNEEYDLPAVIKHLKEVKKDKVHIKSISFLEKPINIPGYNASDGCDEYIIVEVTFTQAVFERLCDKVKNNKPDTHVDTKLRKLGYYGLDTWSRKPAVKALLDIEQFRKPPKKED